MKKRPLCACCIVFMIIQVLMLVTGVRGNTPVTDFFEENTKANLIVKGQVYKIEKHLEYHILYLTDAEASYQNQKMSKLNIIVYDEIFTEVSLGNQILATGKWMPFEEPGNPGNYDQKFYYEKQGISIAVWSSEIRMVSDEVWKIRNELAKFRDEWHELLCRVLGKTNGGMLSAMMLGERRELDQERKELYQVNGIGHLLAISGLHLSFVGLSLYHLLRKIGLNYVEAGVIGIIVLGFYTIMTGLSISTIRALIMFVIRVAADMTGRIYDMLTSLSISAVIIVCWRPLYVFDAGFLLSFGAILGILLIYPQIQNLFPWEKKWINGLSVSLAIQIFLFPVTLYFFFEIPVYSILLNMIVIPLMSYLLGSGFIGSFLYKIIPYIGQIIMKSSCFIFSIYDWFCQKVIDLPLARVVLGQPEVWQVALSYVFMFGFVYLCGRRKEKKKKIYLILLVCAVVVTIPFQYRKGKLQVTMLDVGQGDGIFVRGPNDVTYFVDGGSSDVKSVGKYRIEPYLKSQGVGALDYVFVSHGDADHMNGIEEMLERQRVGVKIKTLVLPEKKVWDENLANLAGKAFRCGTKVAVIKEGEQIAEGEFSITCVLPERTYDGEVGNASSMVLLLKYGKFDMLLTGDVEGKGEDALKEKVFSNWIDVLKVAHHGSKNSTGEEVIANLNPKIGFISAGRENQYGHPSKETLKRLEEHGVEIYNTQESGSVWIVTDGHEMKVEKFKLQKK